MKGKVIERAWWKSGLLIPILLVILRVGSAAPQEEHNSSAGDTFFSRLDRLSDQLVNSDRYLGRARVTVSEDHIVHFDIAPDQAVSSSHDLAVRSLDALIRVKALRRDLAKVFPEQTFWIEPLNHAYAIIELLNSDPNERTDEVLINRKMAEVEKQFRDLETLAVSAAVQEHLAIESTREMAPRYKVEVHINPPKARVRYMPLLTYLRCRNLDGGPSLEMQWVDLMEGKTSLIGKYRYRAEWPANLNGTVEGTFDIEEDKILTFIPPPSK